MNKIDIKNKILIIIIALLILAGILLILPNKEIKSVVKENFIINPVSTKKTTTEIKKETENKNMKEINTRLNIINKKFEVLKKYIEDYDELSRLKSEIDSLNETITDKSNEIVKETDMFLDIIDNLKIINTTLENLLIMFGPTKNDNIISGKIIKNNENFLTVVYDKKEYNIIITDNTVIDNNTENSNLVNIFCLEKISNTNNIADLIFFRNNDKITN